MWRDKYIFLKSRPVQRTVVEPLLFARATPGTFYTTCLHCVRSVGFKHLFPLFQNHCQHLPVAHFAASHQANCGPVLSVSVQPGPGIRVSWTIYSLWKWEGGRERGWEGGGTREREHPFYSLCLPHFCRVRVHKEEKCFLLTVCGPTESVCVCVDQTNTGGKCEPWP